MEVQEIIKELKKLDPRSKLEVMDEGGSILGIVAMVNEGDGEPYIEVRDE